MTPSQAVLASLGNNFVQVHEYVLRGLKGDCTTAIILSKLVSFYKYNLSTGGISGEKDSFPFKSSYIEDTLGINEYHQRKSLDALEKKGLITTEFKGFPKKRFITLNFNKIQNLLEDFSEVVDKVVAKSKPTKEFYQEINSSFSKPFSVGIKSSGNIPKKMYEFMYAWSLLHLKHLGEEFVWTPKYYGIFKKYWNHCYAEKPYDYYKLRQFFLYGDAKGAIYEWTVVDRTQPDRKNIVSFSDFIA